MITSSPGPDFERCHRDVQRRGARSHGQRVLGLHARGVLVLEDRDFGLVQRVAEAEGIVALQHFRRVAAVPCRRNIAVPSWVRPAAWCAPECRHSTASCGAASALPHGSRGRGSQEISAIHHTETSLLVQLYVIQFHPHIRSARTTQLDEQRPRILRVPGRGATRATLQLRERDLHRLPRCRRCELRRERVGGAHVVFLQQQSPLRLAANLKRDSA